MTVIEAVSHVKAIICDNWPKMKPVPEEAIIPLCEALWAEGERPNVQTFAKYFPGTWIRIFVPGIAAWRTQRGFRRRARYPAVGRIEDLAPHIAPEIARAPFTCFDPSNDGRWPVPPARVIGYVRGIENVSLRNTMALFAVLKDLTQYQFYSRVVSFTSSMRLLMTDMGAADIAAIDPDAMFRRILDNEIGKGLSPSNRALLSHHWNSIRHCFEDYGEKLSTKQRQDLEPFFLKAVRDRRRLAKYGGHSAWKEQQRARVKARTEVVHDRFHHLRYIARMRLNQVRRMYEATEQAIRCVEGNHIQMPYRFSYEEIGTTESGRSIKQTVHLTLWDPVSWFRRLLELGYSSIQKSRLLRKRSGEFSTEQTAYQVEYRGTDAHDHAATLPDPWFLEPCANYVFSATERIDNLRRRHEFYRHWGYDNSDPWDIPMRIVGWGRHLAEWSYLRERGHLLFSVEAIFVAALFGHLAIRLQTITGARLGEIQQISQNPQCIKELVNVGPKAATRWLLRLIPKGESKERENYYIDEETKNDLIDVIAYLRRRTGATRSSRRHRRIDTSSNGRAKP